MFTLIDQSGVPTDWYTDASSNSTNPGVIDLSNNNNSLGLRFNQNIYQDVSNLTIGSKYRISWNYFTEEGRSGNSLQVYLDNSSIFISTSVYSITPINAFVDFNASKSYHNFKFTVTNDTSDIVYIDDISLKKVNSDGIVLPGLDNINDGYISLDPQPLGSIFTLSTWAKWNDLSNANQYLLNFNDSIKEYPYINKIRVESGSTSTPLNIRELQVWSDGNNVAIPQNSLDYAISSKSIHLKKLRFIATSGIPVQIDDLQVWAYNQNYIDTSNVTITQSSTINLKKLKLQTTHSDSLKVKKLELWVDGINIADNSYNITSQSSIVGENIHFNMIDNDPNTYTETSTATGEYVQLDLSSSISIDSIENIKYFPFEPNSDQSSILQLFDESENILFTFDNSITDVSSYIYQYAGPSYNYNTSNQSTDVLLPYTGDELVFSYNLNYPTTGNYEWLVIKFDANGVAYGVNSQVQLYKNILTTPSSVIYDWTSTDYYHDFTIDNNGNIYFITQAYSSNNKVHLYKITYDSVNDTYSGNTQSDLNQLTQDSNAFTNNQYSSVWLSFRDPFVLFAGYYSNGTIYNVNTNTIANTGNYIPVYNTAFGDVVTGIAFDSQGNIFITKRNTSSPSYTHGVNVVYKSGTIFGSTVDYTGNPWVVDNIYQLSSSTGWQNDYNQDNQHIMFAKIRFCADITIDSNDDIYFSSFGSSTNSVYSMTVIRVDGKTGITNKVVGAGYNSDTGFSGVEWAEGIAADQLKGDHTRWTRWPGGGGGGYTGRLNHGLYWTLDSEGFIWIVGIKNGTKLYKIAKNGEFVNTKFIDLSGYDIVNDQSNNGYTNLDYKRSSGAFGKFLNYRTRNTTTEFLDFTLERSIPINDLQAIVATSVTDPSYNRLYDLFLFDQNNNAIIQFLNSEPAQDYYVYKYTGPDYANYSLGFSTALSYDQIIDNSANINIPSIGTKGVNSKNLFGDYTKFKRIRIENNGTSSINLRELQVWNNNSNVALDCSSSISNEIFLKRIKIETNDLTPIDDTLKSYISNLDHHIDFANFPSNHFNYLKDIGSSSEKMNATLYGNITKDISGINIPLISESNYVDLSDVSLNGVNTITTWVKFDDLSHHSQVLFDFHNLETINGQQGKTNQLTMLTGYDLDGSENQLLLKVTGDQQPHRLKTIRIDAADNVPITLKELQVWSNDKNISQLEKRRYPPQYINVNTRYIPPNTPIYNWDFRVASSTSVTDDIGGIQSTYQNGVTSTVSDGAIFDNIDDSMKLGNVSLNPTNGFSSELYLSIDTVTDARSNDWQQIFRLATGSGWNGDNALALNIYQSGDSWIPWRASNHSLELRNDFSSTDHNRIYYQADFMNVGLTHIVFTVSSTNVLKMYINNVLKGGISIKNTGAGQLNSHDFGAIPTVTRTYNHIGAINDTDTDYNPNMKLKYLRFFNQEFSASEVTDLYNNRNNVTNVDVSLNKVIGEQADASASLVVSNQFYGNGTYVFDAVHSINRNSNPYENFGNVQNIFDNIITHHSGGWAAYTSSISSLFGTDYTNTITTETNTGTINDTSSAAFTFKLPQPILLNSFSHTYDGSNNKQTFKNLKVYGFKNESTVLPTYNWDFRVASSTTVTDSSASLSATFNGGMNSTLNNGATLDGSNDYINLQGFEFGGTFSIESYFKITNNPASSSKLYYFSKSTYSNVKYIKIDQNGSSIKLNEVQLFQGTTNIAQGKEVRYGQNDSTYANAVTTHLSPPWYGNPTAGAYPSTIADGNQTTAHRDYDTANGNYYITLDDNIDFGTLSAITIRCNDTAGVYALPKRISGNNYRMSLLDSAFNTIWSSPNWIGSNSEYYTIHIASLNSYSPANYDTYRAGNDTNLTKVYNYVPISASSIDPLFNLSKYSNNNYFAVESIGSGVDSFPVPDALLQLNVWTHIVVTMDGTEIKVYYNGVLVGTRSDANVRTRSFTDTIYLFTDGSSKIQGNIKHFKYWDGKALSASEVTTLYTDKDSFTNTYTQLGVPFTNSSSDTYAHLSYISDNSGVMYDEYKFVYSGTFQTEEAINLTNIDNSATIYDVSSTNHYGPNPFSISIGTDDSSGNFFGNSLLLHDSNANNLTVPSKSNLFNTTLWNGKNEYKYIVIDLGEKKEFNTFYVNDSIDLSGLTDVSLSVISNEPYNEIANSDLQYSDSSWNVIASLSVSNNYSINNSITFDNQYARYIKISALNDGSYGQKGTLLKKIKVQKDLSENRIVPTLTDLSLNNHLDFVNYQTNDLSSIDLVATNTNINLIEYGGTLDSSGLKLTNSQAKFNGFTYSGSSTLIPSSFSIWGKWTNTLSSQTLFEFYNSNITTYSIDGINSIIGNSNYSYSDVRTATRTHSGDSDAFKNGNYKVSLSSDSNFSFSQTSLDFSNNDVSAGDFFQSLNFPLDITGTWPNSTANQQLNNAVTAPFVGNIFVRAGGRYGNGERINYIINYNGNFRGRGGRWQRVGNGTPGYPWSNMGGGFSYIDHDGSIRRMNTEWTLGPFNNHNASDYVYIELPTGIYAHCTGYFIQNNHASRAFVDFHIFGTANDGQNRVIDYQLNTHVDSNSHPNGYYGVPSQRSKYSFNRFYFAVSRMSTAQAYADFVDYKRIALQLSFGLMDATNYSGTNYTGTVSTNHNSGSVNGSWLQQEFAFEFVPTTIKIVQMSEVNFLVAYATDITVLGSNDGSTWTKITDLTGISSGTTTHNINTSSSFSYYRLVATKSNDDRVIINSVIINGNYEFNQGNVDYFSIKSSEGTGGAFTKIDLDVSGSSTLNTTIKNTDLIQVNKMHHMALTVGTNTKFYFDGTLIATEATPTNIQSTLLRNIHYLGGLGASKEVVISQLSFFGIELTQSNITTLYNLGYSAMYVDKTYSIKSREIQVWVENNNIASTGTITYSGLKNGDNNTLINSNLSSSDVLITNDISGSYYQLEFPRPVDFSGIQSVVIYNDPTNSYAFNNTKITFIDLFEREIDSLENSTGSTNYNIFKYRGPSHESTIPKIRNIRLETTSQAQLSVSEIQIWSDKLNINNPVDRPTNTFIFNGATRSLTDVYSSASLTLVGNPTFDTNGVNLTGSQYITIPQSILGFENNDFSISLWVQANDSFNSNYQTLFSLGYNNNNTALLSTSSDSSQQVYFQDFYNNNNNNTSVQSDFNYTNDGIAHNYLITRTGTSLKVYIDGVEKISLTRSIAYPTVDYHIGYVIPRNNGAYLHGIIKRLDIWKGIGF